MRTSTLVLLGVAAVGVGYVVVNHGKLGLTTGTGTQVNAQGQTIWTFANADGKKVYSGTSYATGLQKAGGVWENHVFYPIGSTIPGHTHAVGA